MRTCEKPCIANVNGKCDVQNCRGPIVRIGQKHDFDLELAAKFYKCSMDSFDDYFGRAGEDVKPVDESVQGMG